MKREIADSVFWDTSLWIYRFVQSEEVDDQKKQREIDNLLQKGDNIFVSVQILSEIYNVLLKKFRATPEQVYDKLEKLKDIVTIAPLTEEHTFRAFDLMKKYNLQWFDSLVVAVALSEHCTKLYSEDMPDGLKIEGQLTIHNPFFSKK